MRSTLTSLATASPSRSTWPLMNNMRCDGVGENTAPLIASGGKDARTSAGSSDSGGTRSSGPGAGFGAAGKGLGGVGACATRGGGAGGGAGAVGAGGAGAGATAGAGAGAGVAVVTAAGAGAAGNCAAAGATGDGGRGSDSAVHGGVRTPRSNHSIQASAATSSTMTPIAIAGQGSLPSRRPWPAGPSNGCACRPGTALRSRSASAFFKASRM